MKTDDEIFEIYQKTCNVHDDECKAEVIADLWAMAALPYWEAGEWLDNRWSQDTEEYSLGEDLWRQIHGIEVRVDTDAARLLAISPFPGKAPSVASFMVSIEARLPTDLLLDDDFVEKEVDKLRVSCGNLAAAVWSRMRP